tara:strand:+ start:988 stop:1206 length:219 start_codon:yes stop_codon:yes gene_type:complete
MDEDDSYILFSFIGGIHMLGFYLLYRYINKYNFNNIKNKNEEHKLLLKNNDLENKFQEKEINDNYIKNIFKI